MGRDSLELTDPRDGWPALGTVVSEFGEHPVAIYIGPVGLSHRDSDDVERRFQNPGRDRPIEAQPGRQLLLLGLWESDDLVVVNSPVVVAADAQRRIGHATRFSVFSRLDSLEEASDAGWAESISTSGEHLAYFHPSLLPIHVALLGSRVDVPGEEVSALARASGLTGSSALAPDLAASIVERTRRTTSALVRRAAFGRDVVAAYGGECAACGLDHGLVQGAHIYPASAPESSDSVTNGVALCPNHHTAFDRHMMWVHPESRDIALHPSFVERGEGSDVARAFVSTTRSRLLPPMDSRFYPVREMFERRYEHFAGSYSWVG